MPAVPREVRGWEAGNCPLASPDSHPLGPDGDRRVAWTIQTVGGGG